LGELKADSGKVRQGANLQVAYFDQMRDALNLEATLEDFISPGSEWIEINGSRRHVKSYLQDFLFSPARSLSPVKSLSGGERSRLLMARLFARPANVLVLDEPTNDLDIDTLELLEEMLQDYAGTVFLVSHDRAFVDNVATSIVAWEGDESPGQWREYEGSVQDWMTQRDRAQKIRDAAQAQSGKNSSQNGQQPLQNVRGALSNKEQSVISSNAPAKAKKLSFKEQREFDSIPAKMKNLETEQQSLQSQLADGKLYAHDPALAAQLAQRQIEIDDELLSCLERQEQLS
jgi:ABC transport system ATP-binding/permease protein